MTSDYLQFWHSFQSLSLRRLRGVKVKLGLQWWMSLAESGLE